MHTPALYLASASPRRRELLLQIGVSHHVFAVDIDESRLAGEAPRDYVLRLALAQKTGLLTVLLLLVKKFWFIGAALVLGVGGGVARLLGFGKAKRAKAEAERKSAIAALDAEIAGRSAPPQTEPPSGSAG